MKYFELLEKLHSVKDEKFAVFQRKLIFTRQTILGVRTPLLRKIAKEYRGEIHSLMAFPDEYYEVTFIKLAIVSSLPYEQFVLWLEQCLLRVDNWATCDCFKAKCILENKDDFLQKLQRVYALDNLYAKRYVLVTMLSYYMDEEYLETAMEYARKTPTDEYYLHMAVAWLTAEIVIKHFDVGVEFLKEKALSPKTHNKAIQKAIESYRLNKEQKEILRSLKIKNNVR